MRKLMNDLEELREQNFLQDIDLELCRFLEGEHQDLSEEVLLAACLVGYLYRQGDVCLLLEKYASQTVFEDADLKAPDLEYWKQSLADSPVVGAPGDFKPLILDQGERLYLHKLWCYENELADQLINRSQQKSTLPDIDLLSEGLERLFPNSDSSEIDWQQVAAVQSVRNKLSIISGGPGTGKTSTVVRILALMLEQYAKQGKNPGIALAAPTGKAAARLKESLTSAKQSLNVEEEIRALIPEKTITLHQLLGARRHSSVFKHNEENPVPYEVVVVDEASMIDQALMSKLMNALPEDTRLILLGDKDQLASVEAGSVLGDICNINQNEYSKEVASRLQEVSLTIPDEYITDEPQPLSDHITLLTKSYRFDSGSGIAQLAASVNSGDFRGAVEVLESDRFDNLSLYDISDNQPSVDLFEDSVTAYFKRIIHSETKDKALRAFEEFRILAAHRRGPWGVEFINRYVEQILREQRLVPKYEPWYPGKPVIVDVNDYSMGLYNGDTGVCLKDADGQLKVYFRHEESIRGVAPARLPGHNTAFALTVHKSQGSEFDRLFFILPTKPSQVLSRELVYTAITRSRTEINILGSRRILKYAIQRKMKRSSGLKKRLWN